MKYDLADRTVAITGAAGGLGADLAKALRTRGARIALLDLHAGAVRELADQLGGESVARIHDGGSPCQESPRSRLGKRRVGRPP